MVASEVVLQLKTRQMKVLHQKLNDVSTKFGFLSCCRLFSFFRAGPTLVLLKEMVSLYITVSEGSTLVCRGKPASFRCG